MHGRNTVCVRVRHPVTVPFTHFIVRVHLQWANKLSSQEKHLKRWETTAQFIGHLSGQKWLFTQTLTIVRHSQPLILFHKYVVFA